MHKHGEFNKWIDDIQRLWFTAKWKDPNPAHRWVGKIEECAYFFQKKSIEIRKEIRAKI